MLARFLILIFFGMGSLIMASSPDFNRGMTVSCHGSGQTWGTKAFHDELDRLKKLGVDSIAIHPYSFLSKDGTLRWRLKDDGSFPDYYVTPVREVQKRGMTIMVKPHVGYWGSGFSWRGEIQFEDPAARKRFEDSYHRWIVELAKASDGADFFVVGAELKGFLDKPQFWRDLIKDVCKQTSARLTYAANWDTYNVVDFWDDLDYIGVQAYFPITDQPDPNHQAIKQGWQPILSDLRNTHTQYGKPVLFTEMGYNRSMKTAAEPWAYEQDEDQRAEELQARCLEVGLQMLRQEKSWIQGAWLWKWFAGPARRANYKLDTPLIRDVIRESYGPGLD